MGYCTATEYHRFLHQTPIFERMLVEDGIILLKYWFSVSDVEQENALQRPRRRPDAALEAEPERCAGDHQVGGLLPREGHDVRAHRHPRGKWWEVDNEDKRRGRINTIAHLLSQIPYEVVEREDVVDPAAAAVGRLRAPAPRHDLYRSRLSRRSSRRGTRRSASTSKKSKKDRRSGRRRDRRQGDRLPTTPVRLLRRIRPCPGSCARASRCTAAAGGRSSSADPAASHASARASRADGRSRTAR